RVHREAYVDLFALLLRLVLVAARRPRRTVRVARAVLRRIWVGRTRNRPYECRRSGQHESKSSRLSHQFCSFTLLAAGRTKHAPRGAEESRLTPATRGCPANLRVAVN